MSDPSLELGLYRFNREGGWVFTSGPYYACENIEMDYREVIFIFELKMIKKFYIVKLLRKGSLSTVEVFQDFFLKYFEKIT